MKGYIKDYRKELDSDIWLMPPLYHRVWQYIKYMVNHQANRIPMKDGTFITLEPGQHLTSMRNIAKGVGYYERAVWKQPNSKTIKTILDWLVSQNMIEISNGKGNSQFTLIILLNWESYQSKEDESNSKETVNGQGGKQSADINKNEEECSKNDKEEKTIREIKDLRASFSSDLIELVDTYWTVIKKTRKTKKISYNVILQTMQQWTKYDQAVIKFALKRHIEAYDDGEKKENYTLAIMRNTTKEKALDELNKNVTAFKPRQKGVSYDEPSQRNSRGDQSASHVRLYQ